MLLVWGVQHPHLRGAEPQAQRRKMIALRTSLQWLFSYCLMDPFSYKLNYTPAPQKMNLFGNRVIVAVTG